MNNILKDILTEVLVFPYEEETIDRLTEACETYADEISLAEYEACVLYLCRSYTNLKKCPIVLEA